jgi:hypothetical protein
MKRRSILTVLLAVIVLPLVLLIAGVTSSKSYDPFKSLSTLRGSANPTTSLFVAQDAPISLSLTVNPDRLLSVSSTPLNFGKSKTQDELENLRDSLLGLGELDYKTNVLPWLGDELTLAVTSRDVDRTLADGRQPGYLLALKTNDAIASRAFLHEFWRVRSAVTQQTETYQGSEITYGQVKKGQVKNAQVKNAQVKKGQIKNSQVKKSVVQLSDVPFTLASAIVGNQYVLFANSPKVLKNAINNVQVPSLNLQGNDQYQRALEAIDSKDLGILYINLPEFTALTGDDSIVRSLVQLPTVSPITYSTMAMGLRGSRSGLILDTVLVPDDELSSESDRQTVQTKAIQTKAETKAIQTKSTTLDILEVLPDRSMAVAVGNDLAELWPTLSNTVRGYPALETLQTQALQSLASQLQLNLIQDVFQWVKGDYGFSIAPIKPNQPTQWVFAVKRDGQEIEQGIAKLDKIARDRGLTIGSVKLGDQTVQAWTQLSSSQNTQLTVSTIAAHTTIGNYEVFSTSLKMLENLANKSEKTLNQSLDWTLATREIDNPNQGYAYVEWNDVQPLLEKQVPGLRLIEILAQPIVTHLKSLTISASEYSVSESSALRNSASIAKGTVVIGLK